jgi:hypothetical protein
MEDAKIDLNVRTCENMDWIRWAQDNVQEFLGTWELATRLHI